MFAYVGRNQNVKDLRDARQQRKEETRQIGKPAPLQVFYKSRLYRAPTYTDPLLIRNSDPLGPYSRPLPRAIWWPW